MHETDLVVVSRYPAGEVASIARIIAQYAAERLAPALRYRKSCNAEGGGGDDVQLSLRLKRPEIVSELQFGSTATQEKKSEWGPPPSFVYKLGSLPPPLKNCRVP